VKPKTQYRRARFILFGMLISLMLGHLPVSAQYIGLNLRGDVGVKAGSQPGPGVYLIAPLWYRNDYEGLRGANGDEIGRGLNLDLNILTPPAIAVTTKAKLAGATYGFQVVPLLLNTRPELAESGRSGGQSYGFGDLYLQPINLGWRAGRADFLAAYGFYAPTGADGRSLNMWAHEIVGGATVYLDTAKRWHVSTAGFYEIHQNKQDIDLRVGDILTLEGGAGRSFLKGAASAGISYVAQWKVTNDSGSDFPERLRKSKGRAFGLGPDISAPVFAKGTLLGLVGFRYTFEFGARTNFEGQTLVLSFTLAKLSVD
jgi:hypothetical protein